MIIGLMVKNEAASIAQTVESLRALAPKARLIVFDTGSDDGTPERAAHVGAEVRTDVVWAESGRYDDSYNAMLAACEEIAQPEEWIMHAYGRRIYSGSWSPPATAALVASIEHWSEHCDASRVVAYRAQLQCRYLGATHEILQRPDGVPVEDSGVRMVRAACDHPRPERFERDLALLEADSTPRAAFYRAQTLACLERIPEAYGAYLQRADLEGQGDDNEVVVALFRAIMLAPRHPALLPAMTRMCYGALRIDENRGEPWMALAEFCLGVGRHDLAGRYALMARVATPDPFCLFRDPTVAARADALLSALQPPEVAA
jgi:glycosyltransferase involved in cell wall biosynthesis